MDAIYQRPDIDIPEPTSDEEWLRCLYARRKQLEAIANSDYQDMRAIGEQQIDELDRALSNYGLDPESKALRAWEGE